MNIVVIIRFLFDKLLPILIVVWLTSIVVAICCLSKEEWHNKAKGYLRWALFPFEFLFQPRKLGFLKSWTLFFISPCMISVYYATLHVLIVFVSILNLVEHPIHGVPSYIPYHNADDLTRITGVEFPDVIPVDSTYEDSYAFSQTSIKFVPLKPVSSKFFQRLERACKEDSCCWSKDIRGYHYFIFPERPIDRTKGTHIRQVKLDGEKVNDWDGDFLEVIVPLKGDTIYVNDGWCL